MKSLTKSTKAPYFEKTDSNGHWPFPWAPCFTHPFGTIGSQTAASTPARKPTSPLPARLQYRGPCTADAVEETHLSRIDLPKATRRRYHQIPKLGLVQCLGVFQPVLTRHTHNGVVRTSPMLAPGGNCESGANPLEQPGPLGTRLFHAIGESEPHVQLVVSMSRPGE